MKIRFLLLVLFFSVALIANSQSRLINTNGTIVSSRFLTPSEYERVKVPKNSFGHYLQSLPLKPAGSKVHYYNGKVKYANVYDAVVEMEIGTRDLQQCADAIIRLHAEYLYSQKQFAEISFNFTNGFKADYNKWMQGYRVGVDKNKTWWKQSAAPSNNYASFRKYLDVVFTYAGTLSLSKSLKAKSIENISIGDVFIVGGSPGHAVIVLDIAQKNGKKLILLAQSYMPAQDIQILKNTKDGSISPWYRVGDTDMLYTPEWTFNWTDLKGF